MNLSSGSSLLLAGGVCDGGAGTAVAYGMLATNGRATGRRLGFWYFE